MRNFIAIGNTITVLAAAAATSGDGVLVGALFGVAAHNAAVGDELVVNVTGVYELPKTPSQAWTQGQKVYWDNTNKRATSGATDNTLIGVAYAAVGGTAAETIGTVRLNGTAV